jgi:hypothetical protein
VKNFTLSLYAFHLCPTFDNTLDEVNNEAPLLWENLVKLGDEALPFHELKNLRSHLQCYTNDTYQQGTQYSSFVYYPRNEYQKLRYLLKKFSRDWRNT